MLTRPYLKRFLSSLLLLLFSLPVFALDDAVNTGRFNDTAIDGYDSVAYFTQGRPVKGQKQFQFTWHAASWRFSSEENLILFKANPQQYAPQYGGWCAYAMADEGRTVRIDPEAWQIDTGKLYLNYSQSVQQDWLAEKVNNIQQADHYYPLTTDIKKYGYK
jgi:YHS domain-containing protein